jgi:hypothetical protein
MRPRVDAASVETGSGGLGKASTCWILYVAGVVNLAADYPRFQISIELAGAVNGTNWLKRSNVIWPPPAPCFKISTGYG